MISTARSSAPPAAAGLWPAAAEAAPVPAPAPAVASRESRRSQLAKLLVPLVVANGLVLLLCVLGLHLLSAARGFVGGESKWSKAHAIASVELRAYAATESPQHLNAFREALDLPLADREARGYLDLPELDDASAEALDRAYARGGIDVDDRAGITRLYRWFGGTPLMQPSIEAWQRGDDLIAELQQLGDNMQRLAALPRGPESVGERLLLLQRLDRLDAELREQELRFSDALGTASRNAYHLIAITTGVITFTLTLGTGLLIVIGVRRHHRDALALTQSNQRWALAAQADGIGIAEWTIDDAYIRLDARACAIYGFSSPPEGLHMLRSLLRERIEPLDIPLMQEAETRAIAGQVPNLRYRIHVGGQIRHLEITGKRHDNEKGASLIVVILRDVSAQVQQEQLKLEKTAAERSAAARIEFLSRLSHELRTPLNAVLGFSELLQMDANEPLTDRQLQRVQLISGAGVHLLRLVDDVLDISGIDAGQFKLHRVPTQLAPVVRDALSLNSDQQGLGAVVELDPIPASITVWADAQRLGQVLVNLINNACKYNRPGGRVRLSVEASSAQRVEISISDEGPGMTEAEIKQLFQPFKRLPSGADKPGTGLGLTIVKMLTEQMGGSITVQSLPGRGSVFTVSLHTVAEPASISTVSSH